MDVISAAPACARNLSREKREAILDGAALVFAARGYEGASMSMITAAAGVSRGTIYQHFTGKAALFGAAVARECERSLAPLFQTAAASKDLPSALRTIGHRFVTMLLSDSCRAIERVVHAEAERFPELALAFFEAGPAPAIAMMSRLLSAHAAAGDLVVDDPDFAAEQFFTLCQTRVVARRRLGLPVAPGDEARAVEGAVVVFLSAYGKAG
jgi:AcrR family transcriptional regulator